MKNVRKFFHREAVFSAFRLAVRVSLALLFVYGGLTKLLAPKAFAATLSAYHLVPDPLLPWLAIGLPLTETAAGLALLLDRPWGLHWITGLLVLFVFVLGYAILRELDVDCGCFGATELDKRAGLRKAFYRDLVLLTAGVPYLYRTGKEKQMKVKQGLVAVLAAFWLVFGMVGGAHAAWGKEELETEKTAVTFAGEVERGGYRVVTTQQLKNWIDQRKPMLIVDTMPYEASYKKQHVPGAVQMEFPVPEMKQMDEKTKASLERLLGPDKERLIVFYCGFTKCTRSHNGAMWAVRMGYKNVYRQPGGIKAWDEADYPTEKAK